MKRFKYILDGFVSWLFSGLRPLEVNRGDAVKVRAVLWRLYWRNEVLTVFQHTPKQSSKARWHLCWATSELITLLEKDSFGKGSS